MADQSLSELYASALAAAGGSGPGTVVPDGQYRVQLTGKKIGVSKSSNKPQYGLKWTLLDGPYANQSVWTNQTFTERNQAGELNLQAIGIYLSQLIQLGVDEALVRSGTVPPAELPNYVVKGLIGTATFGSHVFGTNPADGQPKIHQDLKRFVVESIPAQTMAAPGVPNIPTQAAPVVSIPTPAIPAPVPVGVPVAVPLTPVASVTSAPTVEQLQAQIAAMTSAAPVVSVSVPPLPQAPSVPAAPTGTVVKF